MYKPLQIATLEVVGVNHALRAMRNPRMSHERAEPAADHALARKLIRAGDEHAKAIRGIIAYFEMDCQIGWMVEFDTYRIGVETLSTSSTMYMDLSGMKGAALAAAKQAGLADVVYHRTCLASYQALRRIYYQRQHHRHPDWQIFCEWIRGLELASELILCE